MPRDAIVLSDLESPTLRIVCDPCGRRGRYAVARLIAVHGDMRLPDLLAAVARCQKANAFSLHDRCKARFEPDDLKLRGARSPPAEG